MIYKIDNKCSVEIRLKCSLILINYFDPIRKLKHRLADKKIEIVYRQLEIAGYGSHRLSEICFQRCQVLATSAFINLASRKHECRKNSYKIEISKIIIMV